MSDEEKTAIDALADDVEKAFGEGRVQMTGNEVKADWRVTCRLKDVDKDFLNHMIRIGNKPGTGPCTKCGEECIFHDNIKTEAKLICMECYGEMAKTMPAAGYQVHGGTVDIVRNYLRNHRMN